MTEGQIDDLKVFLEKKIEQLRPKKLKGVKSFKIHNIQWTPSFFNEEEGNLEITIDAVFDYSVIDILDISSLVKKVSNFVKYITNTMFPSPKVYVYWV